MESDSQRFEECTHSRHHVSRGVARPYDPVWGAVLQFDETAGSDKGIHGILVLGPHSEFPGPGQMGGIQKPA